MKKAVFRISNHGLALASVRYRGLLPACAMRDMGWNIHVSSGADGYADARLAFAVKPLLRRDADWITAADRMRLPVVIDLCDNIFVNGYGGVASGIADNFKSLARGRIITTPTAELKRVILAEVNVGEDQVFIVPDIVETPLLLRMQKRLIGPSSIYVEWLEALRGRIASQRHRLIGRRPRFLWFGNHGASYGSFGLRDLELFWNALREASERYDAELLVISNNRQKFLEVAKDLPIASRYIEWSPAVVDSALSGADVCLVPSSMDAFSRTKSANRALKALSVGVPVVATPTPAYAGLEDAVWLADPSEGIAAYLEDMTIRAAHLANAARVITRDFSMHALKKALLPVIDAASRGQQA